MFPFRKKNTEPTSDINEDNIAPGYLFMRLAMGANMLPHGAMRFQNLDGFATGVAEQFAEVAFFGLTVIPYDLAYAYAIVLCFVEALIGILLLVGWQVRSAALAGGFMMVTLMFGKALQAAWSTVGSMWMYLIFFFFIAVLVRYDRYSLDRWIKNRKS